MKFSLALLPVLALALVPLRSLAQEAPAAKPNTLTAEEAAEGYKLLFDGTPKLLLFKGVQKSSFLQSGWKIADGELGLEKTIQQSGKQTGGDLATNDSYVDFDFKFDFKQGVSGNSGVVYFVKSSIGGKVLGSEFQLIDDTHHPEGLKGGPLRRTGALNGVFPPNDKKTLDVMGWNTGRLVVQGNHVEHWVNGEKVLEYEVGSPAMQAAVKASPLKLPMGWGAKSRSPIVLLDQGENVAFRNLKIKVLTPPAAGGVAR